MLTPPVPGDTAATGRFVRLETAWKSLAVVFLNTALLFCVVNSLIYATCDFTPLPSLSAVAWMQTPAAGRPHQSPLRIPWQLEHVDTKAFAGFLSEPAVDALLDDMTRMCFLGVEYRPWTEYTTAPFHSDTINIEGDGADNQFQYRRSVPDPAPVPAGTTDEVTVYLFGGSTTFGWDTPDRYTVGTCLWNALQKKYPHKRVHLVNYGRPLWYSTQEALLFTLLLKAGHRPDVAVFLDGLNDTYQMAGLHDQGYFTPRLTGLLKESQFGKKEEATIMATLQWLPIVKLAQRIHEKLHPETQGGDQVVMDDATPPQQAATFVLSTFRGNRRWAEQLARANGVQFYSFWQPAPIYRYDRSLHRTWIKPTASNVATYKRVYEAMQGDPDSIWLGDLLETWGHRKAFVDDVHYAPGFTQFLADRMARSITL